MKADLSRASRSLRCAVALTAVVVCPAAWAHGDREVVSEQGRKLAIAYYEPSPDGSTGAEVEELTTKINRAHVCSEAALDLTSATLWMTEHGHGSAPTSVLPDAASEGRCAWIGGMEFVMPGNWEVRLELGQGDRAVFHAHLHE